MFIADVAAGVDQKIRNAVSRETRRARDQCHAAVAQRSSSNMKASLALK